MSQTIIQRLAERVHSFGEKNLTKQAIELSRTAIIDTIGVTLAGSVEPCAANLLRTPGVAEAPGPCTLLGTYRKTSALDATFFNGTASHALDYDDFSQPMGGHQSAPLVAPLLAVAEERRLSGAQLIQSYVVGVETEIRLARSVNFHHYDKGWHPTATMGVFGAAAAVGHMIGLDAERLSVALAIAASFASGVKANFGTMVKTLHVGQCARNGLLASLLADAGYDANPAVLEHKQGFFNAFNGPGNYAADNIFEHWADPLEITGKTMGLKQFPCCGSTHPAIAMCWHSAKRSASALTTSRRSRSCRTVAACRIPTIPARRRRSRPSSACNMQSPAPCSTARCASPISRATRISTRASARFWPGPPPSRIQTWPTTPMRSSAPRSA